VTGHPANGLNDVVHQPLTKAGRTALREEIDQLKLLIRQIDGAGS
jgi:hypothetical protein